MTSPLEPIRHECLQKNVMLERNLKQAIALYLAAGKDTQSHRALDDCYLCLDIINSRTTPPLPAEKEEQGETDGETAPPEQEPLEQEPGGEPAREEETL